MVHGVLAILQSRLLLAWKQSRPRTKTANGQIGAQQTQTRPLNTIGHMTSLDLETNKEPTTTEIVEETKKRLDLFKTVIPSITKTKNDLFKDDESLLKQYRSSAFM